ncbi:4-carboxymuconolactone decarboxylase, partial [Streptomyces sp. NPDC003832]
RDTTSSCASHLVPVEQPAAVTDLLVRHFSTAWQPAHDSSTGQVALPAYAPKPVPANVTASPVVPVAAQPAPIAEIAPAPVPVPLAGGRPDPYDAGIKVRREVLGDAHVDRALSRADEFSGDFQEFVTRYAWGEIWDRPGLDRRSRSCVTLTALVAGGHLEELAFHTRAALRNGLTPVEIKEVLLQAAVYCGVPAANSAFTVAQQVIREETTPTE